MEKIKALPVAPWRHAWRAAKTLFFLFAMLGSLLLSSAPPLLVALLDIALPSAIYHALVSPLSLGAFVEGLRTFNFRTTLVDVPLLSISRSLVIVCVYALCDGPGKSRGPYLGVAMVCCMGSVGYVVEKAAAASSGTVIRWWGMEEAVLVSSVALGVAHAVVAYRTSCRERRKLLVYKIDLEAVSALKATSNKKGTK